MKRKIIIILLILGVCILIASPVVAKQKVKIKVSTDVCFDNQGYVVVKLVDKNGREISTDGMVNLTVTDKNGNYKWIYKSYNHGIREKYPVGKYKVKVTFFGDSHYKKAKKTKNIKLKNDFDAYTYYEDHNYGLNQEMDDYLYDNYWYDEIYDDVDDPENEAWDI